MICQDTSLPSKVADNTKRFRTKMGALGFTVSGDNHAISPVMLGDAKLASRFSELMLSNYRIFHLFSYDIFSTRFKLIIYFYLS